jgi:chromosome partitioning protein
MRSIAIMNQKGGVGKTTTTVHVADALARLGNRVLLVDLDPQSHATLHVGIEVGDDETSIYDVLTQGGALADAARGVGENLVIIPAHLNLVGAELELSDRPDRERVLAQAVRPYTAGFDFCLIDCPPSLGLLTVNALATVHEVIIPLQPHFLALQGLGRLLETVTLVRESLNPQLRISGIVLCMHERATRLAQEVHDDVTGFLASASQHDPWHGARLYDATIRRNIKLAECPSFGQTVFAYAPGCNGAEDYMALAREIVAQNGAGAAVVAAASKSDADVPRREASDAEAVPTPSAQSEESADDA